MRLKKLSDTFEDTFVATRGYTFVATHGAMRTSEINHEVSPGPFAYGAVLVTPAGGPYWATNAASREVLRSVRELLCR